MAHESFEDTAVADALNRSFVCIKVDREERPDIDSIYMTACQLLNGRGGWPLSIVMTPERKPFFAASFIPRHSVPGMPGIIELMKRLADAWRLDRPTALGTAEAVNKALIQFGDRLEPRKLKGDEVDRAYQSLLRSYDEVRTGFDDSPKFPTPHRLMFLIDYYSRTNEKAALDMAMRTLRRMRESGLFDHVGFGFFRYSTDGEWHLPHFEKTLYDQAMMALAYTKAFRVTGEVEMKETAEKVLGYAERSLMSPQGLFFSAESADSEGKEGKFYLWTLKELQRILETEELDLIKAAFDIKEAGNFDDEATRIPTGLNLLDLGGPITSIAEAKDMTEAEARRTIEISLGKLFDARENRIHPDKDDKVLTDWNGIMIAAFAQAAQTFKEPRYLATARRAADGIWLKMQHGGRLYHRSIAGAVAIEGFLDDYANYAWGLLEIYHSCYDRKYLDRAVELTEAVLQHFSDAKGGFFQTGDSSEGMIVRLKEVYDGAIPSGNSVMAMNLVTIGILTGERRYLEYAERTFEAFTIDLAKNPAAYAHLLSACAKAKGQGNLLTIIGKDNGQVSNFMMFAERLYNPDLEVVRYDDIKQVPENIKRSILAQKNEIEPIAFLFSDFSHVASIHDRDELERSLALLSKNGS
jgi:uncharacterized protein YyaL (SSP411 family)